MATGAAPRSVWSANMGVALARASERNMRYGRASMVEDSIGDMVNMVYTKQNKTLQSYKNLEYIDTVYLYN